VLNIWIKVMSLVEEIIGINLISSIMTDYNDLQNNVNNLFNIVVIFYIRLFVISIIEVIICISFQILSFFVLPFHVILCNNKLYKFLWRALHDHCGDKGEQVYYGSGCGNKFYKHHESSFIDQYVHTCPLIFWLWLNTSLLPSFPSS